MDYSFAAEVKKVALSSKMKAFIIGEPEEPELVKVDTPLVTVTLTYHDERAVAVAARLGAFQGREVEIVIDGEGRQLSLG